MKEAASVGASFIHVPPNVQRLLRSIAPALSGPERPQPFPFWLGPFLWPVIHKLSTGLSTPLGDWIAAVALSSEVSLPPRNMIGVNSDDGFRLTIGSFSVSYPSPRGPGDSLPDGSTVQSIEPALVTLDRDGVPVTIKMFVQN